MKQSKFRLTDYMTKEIQRRAGVQLEITGELIVVVSDHLRYCTLTIRHKDVSVESIAKIGPYDYLIDLAAYLTQVLDLKARINRLESNAPLAKHLADKQWQEERARDL